jgi:hypothetical protein
MTCVWCLDFNMFIGRNLSLSLFLIVVERIVTLLCRAVESRRIFSNFNVTVLVLWAYANMWLDYWLSRISTTRNLLFINRFRDSNRINILTSESKILNYPHPCTVCINYKPDCQIQPFALFTVHVSPALFSALSEIISSSWFLICDYNYNTALKNLTENVKIVNDIK